MAVVGLLLALSAMATAIGRAADGATRRSTLRSPFVTGSFVDASDGQGVFTGNLKLASFEMQGGSIVAVGKLVGTIADSTGNAIGKVGQDVTWPLSSAGGSCDLLELRFASLEVVLLDRTVRLEPLELDLKASALRGSEAGSLLCSTSKLANAKAAGDDLATKLNELYETLR